MTDILRHSSKLSPEQQAIGAKCFHPTGTFLEFEKEAVEGSIPDRFDKIAAVYPDKIAVKSGSRKFTYEELNVDSNRIAQAILAESGYNSEPIAIYLNHDCDIIAAIIGVLKAGKIYVPLDPNDPAVRNELMLEDSQARLLLGNSLTLSRLHELKSPTSRILDIDNISSKVSTDRPNVSVSADMIAYIMYTSGSTGKPKAVMQNHRNLLQQTLVYTNSLHISAEDKLTLVHSCANGACTPNLFGTLLNGAALYPFDVRNYGAIQLSKYLSIEGITIYHSIPALFRSWAHSLSGAENFSHLRIVHLSGDAASKKDLQLYKKHLPPTCVFVHRLGSREANTIFLHLMDKHCEFIRNMVPVGPAVQGKGVFLIDDNGERVRDGEVGEIVIKSRYLSPGYWRDPERTKAVFEVVPDENGIRTFRTGDLGRLLPDGSFEHLGRKDDRVKIRGYRVETAEVELTILNQGDIKEVAVVARENRDGETELVAYIVSAVDPVPPISELRRFIETTLPLHMIPSAFMFMSHLPVLPGGKLDRNALPEPTWNRQTLDSAFVPPHTPVEKTLSSIWREVFEVEEIGIKDSFFDFGGHSLTATKIIAAICETYQVEAELRLLFDNPTIEKLAAAITEKLTNESSHH